MDKEREENSVKAGQTMQEIQLNMDIKEQGAGKMPRKEWMKMQIESRSENEEFARVTVAVFMSRMDPTLEEINDVKTAVSEAVTNCVIHGYGNGEGIIYIEAGIEEDEPVSYTHLDVYKRQPYSDAKPPGRKTHIHTPPPRPLAVPAASSPA